MKKVYKHPLYKYPSLYNDVAVIELGRRIEYNYEKFGDSKRDTLIGIVSGGVGCGNGIPGWYTKVPNNNVHKFKI